MKVEISLEDQLGVSQKVLTVLANYKWNLLAMEVQTGKVFLHLEEGSCSLSLITQALSTIEAFIDCVEIDALPNELKESHLQALLARITTPILDIDAQGQVITVNEASQALFTEKELVGVNVDSLLNISRRDYQNPLGVSVTVNINNQSYIADITSIFSNNDYRGAVVMLRETRTLGRELSALRKGEQFGDGIQAILSQSKAMAEVKEQALRFAQLDLPVLLRGETGTGKELLARAIHESSARAQHPFLAINCAALPEHLLESELFGYQAGAFTGAQKGGKPGLFELSDGGTVFLDEIAEMSVYLQAKLLRFLENYQYRRVGGTQELSANVRIISATHQDLVSSITQKVFREDLYYRLNVLSITIAPLRERLSDLKILIPHFVALAAKQVALEPPIISDSGYQKLADYHWPGNVRQLQNGLFRLVALAQSNVITEKEIEQVLAESGQGLPQSNILTNNSAVGTKLTDYSECETWQEAQATFELELLTQLLPLYPTTRALAKRLGVSHNKIAMKLRQHQLS